MVPEARIELARSITPRDFKSLASTYSATRAFCEYWIEAISKKGFWVKIAAAARFEPTA